MSHTLERKAYRKRKNICNRIGRLNGEDLLKNLILKLNHEDARKAERLQYYEIWHLLLLVKWTILYGDFSSLKHYGPVSEYHVTELLNRVKELSDLVRPLSSQQDVELFLRCLSYQQFWVSRTEYIPVAFRYQTILFGGLDPGHPHSDKFRRLTRVSTEDFINLSTFLLYLTLSRKTLYVTKESFSPTELLIDSDKIVDYLHCISITVDDARKWLQQHSKYYEDVSAEYFEQSPLWRYPLIKHENHYFVISEILLHTSLSTFVADVLRDYDAQWFMRDFGPAFEALLGRSLSSIMANVVTEEALKDHFGHRKGQRYVDFLIRDQGCNIYIEAKGIDLRWDLMVTGLPQKIVERADSILKGIDQAYNLANSLPPEYSVGDIKIGQGENYLLIVTFKDTYLGNGQHYRDEYATAEIDEIISKYGGTELIPLSHIFFISIDELEIILGQIANGCDTFSELLASAVELGKTVKHIPIFRSLVTRHNREIKITPFLEQAAEDVFNKD